MLYPRVYEHISTGVTFAGQVNIVVFDAECFLHSWLAIFTRLFERLYLEVLEELDEIA